MPADKRKMWLGDDVKFYEPIEELGGSFRSRLGNFQNFLLDRQDRGPNLPFFGNFERPNDQFQGAHRRNSSPARSKIYILR